MTLLGLLIAVAFLIFALWLTTTFLPAPWKTPVLVIIVLVALAFILVTLWPGAATFRVR